MKQDEITADIFLQAFASAWTELYEKGKEAVEEKYGDNRSWTEFLFGIGEIEISDPAEAPQDLFTLTAHRLKHKFDFASIGAIRKEDYKIDMMIVGGKPIDKWKNNWGYASRCMVMVEHENQMEFAYEELYNLLVRRGELKVLAFPEWKENLVSGRGEKKKNDKVALDQTLETLRSIAKEMPGHGDVLLLVSKWTNDEIRWRYLTSLTDHAGKLESLDELDGRSARR